MARADRIREVLYVNNNPKESEIVEISRQFGLYFVKINSAYGIQDYTMPVRQFNKFIAAYNKNKKENK